MFLVNTCIHVHVLCAFLNGGMMECNNNIWRHIGDDAVNESQFLPRQRLLPNTFDPSSVMMRVSVFVVIMNCTHHELLPIKPFR